MPGGQYVALSALRTRLQQLDELAENLANVGTHGYRGGRTIQRAADREEFNGILQSAVDTSSGATRIDSASGTMATTNRALDVAIEGEGFFALETAQGMQYTRNGHFQRSEDGTLITPDGAIVQGADGPITLGAGEARIDGEGRVWSGAAMVGRLSVVRFADPGALQRATGARLTAGNQTPEPLDVEDVHVRPESLEESNVATAEGLARLTSVSRSFEALQRSIGMLLNDVDGRFIDQMGRR